MVVVVSHDVKVLSLGVLRRKSVLTHEKKKKQQQLRVRPKSWIWQGGKEGVGEKGTESNLLEMLKSLDQLNKCRSQTL